MNTDKLSTLAGLAAAGGLASQIDATKPHWWVQLISVVAVAVLGWLTNKSSR